MSNDAERTHICEFVPYISNYGNGYRIINKHGIWYWQSISDNAIEYETACSYCLHCGAKLNV